MKDTLLYKLQQIVSSNKKALLQLGGSSVTTRKSPTSDIDFFAIAEPELLSDISVIVSSIEKSDLETRDLEWLWGIHSKLINYEPKINGGPSEFSFWDMRFLARALKGTTIIFNDEISTLLFSIENKLRIALAEFMSTNFINCYEDVLGLYLAERYEETLIIAGELAQRSCLLALLQSNLIDPSPKWAVKAACEAKSSLLKQHSLNMLNHLGLYTSYNPKDWVKQLLDLSNSIVASGICNNFKEFLITSSSNSGYNKVTEPNYCLMGIPNYLTAVDFVHNKIWICNQTMIGEIARGFIPSIFKDQKFWRGSN